ncbi:U-box domain-containing protein 28 [Spatholobus suberectus]|nr:U-box domain-containing protein 28 [Spatholobus suberectus]
MKSLMSLYTGVTYDHSNIQNWLDGSNNTCLATMQVLQTKTSFPIALYKASSKSGPIQSAIKLLPNRSCPRTKPSKPSSTCKPTPSCLILDDIEDREGLENSMLKEKKQSLDTLLLLLRQGSSYSKIASARVLQFIIVDAKSKLLIAEEEGVVIELLKSATSESWRDARRESGSFEMVGKEGGTQHFSKWDGRREIAF